ncbi:MAG: hypothetical protein A2W99_05335 [Bacteroidetes bacterium GWF2_33_16]|nr:MAG: hypothetical protein A2X00_17855 [Bacteroidetes bacterium GWE2_32_14]OFY06085.1 MAG: hypothetical protein A2W99_05335 [Bacteroidetes bacterium GWF2_33_16]
MRNIVFLILALFLILGCKEENSSVVYNLSYTCSKSNSKLSISNQKNYAIVDDELYTQFGDYIISITPTNFIVKFDMIRYYQNEDKRLPTFLTLILGDAFDNDNPLLYADFSNNTTISVTPGLCGEVNNDGTFSDKQLTFNILHITLAKFYQEVELPIEYSNVDLNQFKEYQINTKYPYDFGKVGNIIYSDFFPFLSKIFNLDNPGIPSDFYFGNTDSTAIYLFETPQVPPGLEQVEALDALKSYFVWSHKYTEWTLFAPSEGERRTINSTIGFDTQNLIQIYAGEDNIPYTSDDILVYAPRYWERIYVNVATN